MMSQVFFTSVNANTVQKSQNHMTKPQLKFDNLGTVAFNIQSSNFMFKFYFFNYKRGSRKNYIINGTYGTITPHSNYKSR